MWLASAGILPGLTEKSPYPPLNVGNEHPGARACMIWQAFGAGMRSPCGKNGSNEGNCRKRGGRLKAGAPTVMRPWKTWRHGRWCCGTGTAVLRVVRCCGIASSWHGGSDAGGRHSFAFIHVQRGACAGAEHCRGGIGPSGHRMRIGSDQAPLYRLCAALLACCTWLATSWRLSCEGAWRMMGYSLRVAIS